MSELTTDEKIDDILNAYVPCTDCGEIGCPSNNRDRNEAKALLKQLLIQERLDEITHWCTDCGFWHAPWAVDNNYPVQTRDERIAELQTLREKENV